MSVKVFGPLFCPVVGFLVVEFEAFFVFTENSPVSSVSFARIFFQSVACLLILLTLSFAEKQFLFS